MVEGNGSQYKKDRPLHIPGLGSIPVGGTAPPGSPALGDSGPGNGVASAITARWGIVPKAIKITEKLQMADIGSGSVQRMEPGHGDGHPWVGGSCVGTGSAR